MAHTIAAPRSDVFPLGTVEPVEHHEGNAYRHLSMRRSLRSALEPTVVWLMPVRTARLRVLGRPAFRWRSRRCRPSRSGPSSFNALLLPLRSDVLSGQGL